jgi:pimeloyl-ACP methyl ester carboxylesterase
MDLVSLDSCSLPLAGISDDQGSELVQDPQGELGRGAPVSLVSESRPSPLRLTMFTRLSKKTIDIPTLFVQATKDSVLKPEMSAGMDRLLPNLTRREVVGQHWILWEQTEEANRILKEWFNKCVFGRESKL